MGLFIAGLVVGAAALLTMLAARRWFFPRQYVDDVRWNEHDCVVTVTKKTF